MIALLLTRVSLSTWVAKSMLPAAFKRLMVLAFVFKRTNKAPPFFKEMICALATLSRYLLNAIKEESSLKLFTLGGLVSSS